MCLMVMRTLEAMISAVEAPMGKSKCVLFYMWMKGDGILINSRNRLESGRHQNLSNCIFPDWRQRRTTSSVFMVSQAWDSKIACLWQASTFVLELYFLLVWRACDLS